MKFNINSNEEKIIFSIECDLNDQIVSELFEVIRPKPIKEMKIPPVPEIISEPVSTPVIETPKVEPTVQSETTTPETQKRKRRTQAEMEQIRQGLILIPRLVTETPTVETQEIEVTKPEKTFTQLDFPFAIEEDVEQSKSEKDIIVESIIEAITEEPVVEEAPIVEQPAGTPTPEPVKERPVQTRPPIADLVVPSSIVLKMDIVNDSDEKMTMDIEALQLMVDTDKLGAIKYVKDKSGLDLNSAKTYCDILWEKHLRDEY